MNQEERRIVLLGKAGAGKSATGNTILGRNAFRSELSVDYVTEHSELAEAVIGGNRVRVVDTPEFFNTSSLTRDKLAVELYRSFYLSQPGVHAFILVFKYERFTEHEVKMIKSLQKVFGEKVTDHMIILFTHAEGVGEEIINQERSRNEHLRRVLDQCGGRFYIFNNTEPQNRQQVTELLQKIDSMVQWNEEGNQTSTKAEPNNIQQVINPPQNIDSVVEQKRERFYTNEMYEEAQSSTWEEFWEKNKSFFYFGAGVLAAVAAVFMVKVSAINGLFKQ